MEHMTAAGVVATQPRVVTTSEGLHIASFRFAVNQRRYNSRTGSWESTATNWYTVSAFRRLAQNVAASLNKGDHVLVTGRPRVRDWTAGDKSGTSIEIDADSIGHDLARGTTTFVRSARAADSEPENRASGDADGSSWSSAGPSASTPQEGALQSAPF